MTETEKQVVKYDLTEAKISEMRGLYLDLVVDGIDDEIGFKHVETARKVVKGKRIAVEKQRKVFKYDALEYGRMVDSKAKETFSLLEPIENHASEISTTIAKHRPFAVYLCHKCLAAGSFGRHR